MKFIKIFEKVCLSYLLKFFKNMTNKNIVQNQKFKNCCDVDNELVLNWSNM